MIENGSNPEDMDINSEEMKTPEQKEREREIVLQVVLKRLGTPRVGEEEENQAIAERYAQDVYNRLLNENIDIPENIDLLPDENRLVLCTLSDTGDDNSTENVGRVLDNITERKLYDIKLKLTQEKKAELVRIAVLYSATSERISQGWDTSMFSQEEIERSKRGDYPSDED